MGGSFRRLIGAAGPALALLAAGQAMAADSVRAGSSMRPAAYYGMEEAERSDRQLRDAMLTAHNEERDAWKLPPLAWDEALASDAARYAAQMARTGAFRHSARTMRTIPSGENIWMGVRGVYSYAMMADTFLKEREMFRPGEKLPAFSVTSRWQDVGHYTQMIWRGTRQVGCALGESEQFDYLVCRYYPAGNSFGKGPLDEDAPASPLDGSQHASAPVMPGGN
ncbi:hypothetical protein M529_01520 [Sphingobium ummariense RL-3]|uniref:SCP domain-containing protein n=2 Tax=Sphingobium TaxID=165695 RepID=T0JB00_9SPHN|nr:hypothetical protein M529_01520 [Sphingobium ummariense RL-3]